MSYLGILVVMSTSMVNLLALLCWLMVYSDWYWMYHMRSFYQVPVPPITFCLLLQNAQGFSCNPLCYSINVLAIFLKRNYILLWRKVLLADFSDFSTCLDCIRGKLTKLRKYESERSTDLLQLIHTNICEPFPTPSRGGHRYFITFIDDFSRYAYVFLLNQKSDSLEVFKFFQLGVERQLDRKMKVVRSDRGGEYYG